MKRKILLIAALALIFTVVIASNIWKTKLPIQKITVEGNNVVTEQEILKLAEVKLGSEIGKVDLYSTRQNILRNNFIKDVVTFTEYPGTLRIQVTERVPIAVVNPNENIFIDAEGVLISHEMSRRLMDMPLLSGYFNKAELSPGKRLTDENITNAINILIASKEVSPDLYHLVSEIQIRENGDATLYSAEFGVPIMFGRGETIDKLEKLDAFWKDVVRRQGAQALQYVDLRFDNQIVVRWNSEKI